MIKNLNREQYKSVMYLFRCVYRLYIVSYDVNLQLILKYRYANYSTYISIKEFTVYDLRKRG